MSMLSLQADGLREAANRMEEIGISFGYGNTVSTFLAHDAVERMREAADTIDSLQDALRRACQFIAGYGSCPYDTFDLYEPCEESCYQKCSADIDRAECWQRYFENGDDSR